MVKRRSLQQQRGLEFLEEADHLCFKNVCYFVLQCIKKPAQSYALKDKLSMEKHMETYILYAN